MQEIRWWADHVHEELSQGDIVAELPFVLSTSPPQYLRHANMKRGASGWAESDTPVKHRDQRVRFLGVGKVTAGLVLSHCCELDKSDRGKRRVLVAPIAPIETVTDPDLREAILAQRLTASFGMPDVPTLGTCYSDLRSITTLQRDIVDSATRLASMVPAAERRLQAQLVAFLVRLDLPNEKR